MRLGRRAGGARGAHWPGRSRSGAGAARRLHHVSVRAQLPSRDEARGPGTARARRPLGDELARSARQSRPGAPRSEEHTSELQSRFDLVCRLLLEKKKKKKYNNKANRQLFIVTVLHTAA